MPNAAGILNLMTPLVVGSPDTLIVPEAEAFSPPVISPLVYAPAHVVRSPAVAVAVVPPVTVIVKPPPASNAAQLAAGVWPEVAEKTRVSPLRRVASDVLKVIVVVGAEYAMDVTM